MARISPERSRRQDQEVTRAGPLPSWNDGPAKRAILELVARVTSERDYVSPEDRVAVFDNDGTLWCEQPLPVQAYFGEARLRQLIRQQPRLKNRRPFKAILERDMKALRALGKKGVMEAAFATHAGLPEEQFDELARSWLATASHPSLGRLFTRCVYRPQLELLRYLADSRFKVFIVSGGGIDFMRAFSEEVYGIPRERVIGSSVKLRYELRDGRVVLTKQAELGTFDDRETKPQNIGLHVGRRPILAFGNSDGDLAMLRYARSGPGPRLALLLRHDDAEREFAYDRQSSLCRLSEGLDKAQEYGLTLVSMRRDWHAVFDGAN